MRSRTGSLRLLLVLSLVVFSDWLLAFAAATASKLHVRFIGNEAFLISDGDTTLLSDFPYTSGAFGYMTYDFAAVGAVKNGLCLITHGHTDHFDSKLFSKSNFAIIAPPSLLATLDTPRKISFAPEMTYRGIAVQALRTPHGNIEHYSYLVQWHGLTMYFAGDTDDVAELALQANLDVAFITPWQLKKMKELARPIAAKCVVIYHQRADEQVPLYQERRVLQQGETFDLVAPNAKR